MSSFKLLSLVAASTVLAACATTQPPASQSASTAAGAQKAAPAKKTVRRAKPRPLFTMKKGVYRCELNRKVRVTKVSTDQSLAVLRWGKRNYTMRVVNARSGALRYEHKKSGLTWITVVGKSMLLDTKRGKQLANECRV
jgi:membrane-bound inhibitor of C-type lysozyme